MMVISSTKRTSRKGIAANNISEICLWETSDSRKPADIDTAEPDAISFSHRGPSSHLLTPIAVFSWATSQRSLFRTLGDIGESIGKLMRTLSTWTISTPYTTHSGTVPYNYTGLIFHIPLSPPPYPSYLAYQTFPA
ncbi:hypothetical protein I308_106537 [Cryptococcus tetragattii IND107]|uniref:Uncharacterized protein n=1 Tax=Cryptococcus tetragattii IND107 TaxID=1296105 RepID=A0ABR3BHV8_9TREE